MLMSAPWTLPVLHRHSTALHEHLIDTSCTLWRPSSTIRGLLMATSARFGVQGPGSAQLPDGG
ncbi:hypothetical protein HMPREF9057_01371 [Actinomyces sp. oral taxon 171 str. F0337]|nr:hypothetical protein HMPREF9057_01371 [Actinomyces sp. oral taxon 171 str. F0337]